MKIIQNREYARVVDMLDSPSTRDLGLVLLKRRKMVHLNFTTIVCLHVLIFLGSVTGSVWLCENYTVGWYLLPLVLACLTILVILIGNLKAVINFRIKYNTYLKDKT